MRKIVGDEFSFFGNSADTLLPAGAALIGFAAKPADPVSAPSFFGAANDVLQAGALTVSSFDVAASNGTFMTTTLGSGHMSASAEPAANNDSKYGSSGAGPTGGAFVANSEPALQNDPQSGTGGVFPNPETVTLAGSGLVFVNTYGAGVTDPFHTAIIYAEHELQSNFTNSVTIRVSFDFGDAHGFLAYNSFFNVRDTSFANLKTALTAHATSADDIAAVNAFPTAAPSNTHSNSTNTGFWVAAGLQQILGAPGTTLFPNASIDDALILGNGFSWNFDPNNRAAGGYDAIGAIEHEISEGGMGRIGGLGYQNNTWGPMDLFRFTSSGVRDFTGGQDGVTTYFSPNGANPDLTHPYHNSVNAQGTFDGQDPADWQVGGDSFGFGSPGVPGLLSETDLRVMDILGWTRDDFPATTSTTGVVSVHGSATGNLEVAGDHDWFRVQLTAGVQYTIDERGQSVGAGTLSDPFMALYNAAGQFITSNDDGGGSLNSRIVYTPTVTGSYYIDAGAYQDQYSGTYRVSVGTGHFDYAGIWTSASNGSDNTWHVGDFNGDGKTDIFRYLPGQSGADVFLSNGSSFVHDSSWTGAGFGTDGTWHLGDFNGDGKTDIFRYLPGQSGADVFLSNGTKFVHDASWTGAGFGTDGTWHLGDFNGDGKTDIFRYLPGQSGADVFLSNGSSFVHDSSWTGAGFGTDGTWHLGDFNGDGKTDIFRYLPGQSGADVFLSNGTKFVHDASWTGAGFGTDGTWHLGDFNGDGKTDIFRYLPGQSGADVFLSNGSSFVHDSSWTGAGFGTDGTWHLGDFNGDGKTDIFRYLPGQSGADVFLSNGTKFVHDASWTGAGFGTDGTWHLGDFNGDGKTDIFRYLPGQSGADVFLSNGSKFVHDASWTGAGIGSDNQWHVGDFNGDGADDVFRQLSGVDMFLSHFG